MCHLLEGVALVTGGGSGIGQATCVALVRHGVKRLAVLDINVVGLRETKDLVERIRRVDVLQLHVDLAEENSIISGVQRAVDHFGRIDILINNAARAGAIRPSTDVATGDFRKIIDVNLIGLWVCQREAIKQMLKQDPIKQRIGPASRGVIVNLSSTYGLVSPPGGLSTSAYVTSKHGILGITKTDATSFAKDGVRINAVCPGFVNTPAIKEAARASPLVQDEEKKVPMGRFGEPEELAEVICFLASPMSSYMTGTSVVVNGGFTCV
ncbi:uncharacterized protein PV06_05792 [Exophiala oligosperma]|uniref:Uncharacterized protein n=1 Tax=Exophiala oligosperma TaxID=215243 RepID=A0A0D2DGT6_9EURO|nr:uncharacterized protein PV06_05792 [Exophiala oligosperma]KIW42228.1 hypothetical protein PV06_05792 [Exophiala oligosperma]